jgi:plastocyanin
MSSITKRLLKLVFPVAMVPLVGVTGCWRDPEFAEPPPAAAAVMPAAAASQPSGASVSIDNFSFAPPTITVAAGTTVTWVNRDDVPHTVTADDKRFGSKALDTDDRFSQQFTTPGTFPYFCAVHPHMTGRVIVTK